VKRKSISACTTSLTSSLASLPKDYSPQRKITVTKNCP